MNYWRLIEYLMKYLCSLALLSCSSVGVCRCSLPQISHYSFFNALNTFFCQLEMYLMFSINQTFSFDVTCLGLHEACGYAPIGSDGASSASTQPKAPDAVLLGAAPALDGKRSPFQPPAARPLQGPWPQMGSSCQLFEKAAPGWAASPGRGGPWPPPGCARRVTHGAGRRRPGFWEAHAGSLRVDGKLALRPGLINCGDSSLDWTAPRLGWALHCRASGATAVSCRLAGVLDPSRGCPQGLEQLQLHNLPFWIWLPLLLGGSGMHTPPPEPPADRAGAALEVSGTPGGAAEQTHHPDPVPGGKIRLCMGTSALDGCSPVHGDSAPLAFRGVVLLQSHGTRVAFCFVFP